MIDDPEYRALLQRLDRLERETPRVRQGIVTAGAPLAVSLGASPTSFDDVRALHGATVDDGAAVAALTFGNDMLILGGVGAALGIPLVTGLPSPAFDGQVIDYDTGTDGVVWRFRYDAGSGSAYKWQFIGGGWLSSQTTSATALNHAAGSYSDRTTVTLPALAGDFQTTARVAELNTTAGNDTVMVVVNSASRNLDRRLCRNSNASPQSSGGGPSTFTGLSASATLAVSAYHVALGGGSTVGYLGLAVQPLRVG